MVVKKQPLVPSIVSGGLETIALRMPSGLIARSLIEKVGQPLVAPSANLSGSPSSTKLAHVLDDFKGKIAGIIEGECELGIESTVLDLVSFDRPTLLRPGSITKEMLEEVLHSPVDLYQTGPKGSPGMKYRHYAPKIPVRVFFDVHDFQNYIASRSKLFILSSKSNASSHIFLESKTLYSHLRLADQNEYDEVVIFCGDCRDAALLNRLEKITDESHCY